MSKRSREALEQIAALKKSGPYPSDHDEQNNSRASWAQTALLAFMLETGTDACDAVSDLVADLMHWCDRHDVVWDQELTRGQEHYREETLPIEDETI